MESAINRQGTGDNPKAIREHLRLNLGSGQRSLYIPMAACSTA